MDCGRKSDALGVDGHGSMLDHAPTGFVVATLTQGLPFAAIVPMLACFG